ncbi:MAG: hypothetical protein LBS25_06315 [Candidatus Symbiothrix sp.]|jgi:hypothetical protein|nr:hypothetical protein [Candidatus Symbiothrix sp.]
MKRIILLAMTIGMAFSTFADRRTIKDRSENWLQHATVEETTSSDLRLDNPGTTPRGAENETGAIGDMAWLLFGSLGAAYIGFRKKTTHQASL